MQTTREIAIWYLQNCRKGEDRVILFQSMTGAGRRDGEAFMYCLPTGETSRLVVAGLDTFDSDANIKAAVDLLTTKE